VFDYLNPNINIARMIKEVTAHCSMVQVFTPYDNVFTIMHEGASRGSIDDYEALIRAEPSACE